MADPLAALLRQNPPPRYERAGTPGLHTVRGQVKAENRETLLPPELFNRFIHDAFWRDPARTPAGLRVV